MIDEYMAAAGGLGHVLKTRDAPSQGIDIIRRLLRWLAGLAVAAGTRDVMRCVASCEVLRGRDAHSL